MKTHKGLQWGTAVAVVAFRAMYVSNAVADHTWHHYDGDSQGYHELNPKTEYWRSGEESQVYSSALLESPSMTGSARGGAIDLLRAHDRGTPRTIVGTYTSPTYSGGTGDKSYSTYSERGSAADRSQVSTSGEVIQIPPDVVHIESDRGTIRFSKTPNPDWNKSQNVSGNNDERSASINSPNSGGAALGSSGSVSAADSSTPVTNGKSDNYPAAKASDNPVATADTSQSGSAANSTSSTGDAREAAKQDEVHAAVGDRTTADVSNLDRLVQGGAQEPTATPVPEPNSPAPTDSTKEQTSDTQALANNDQSLTQQLRDSIEDDASFSADAKTVQIITAENTVTLRGTVASQAEKDQLEAKAKQLAGIKNVDNQLQVKQ